jgi:hypothetical protein
MATVSRPGVESLFADKKALQEIVAQQNAAIGFVKNPNATAQKARERMRARGIRPEDNEFSREIIAMREEE